MSQQEHVLCNQLGALLDGKPTYNNGSCSVKKQRRIMATVLGRPAHAVLSLTYTFESFQPDGTCLCLAEYAMLSEELQMVCDVLTKLNIQISAIHNHWLFDNPRIMYLHFQTIDNPLHFAFKLSGLSRSLQ